MRQGAEHEHREDGHEHERTDRRTRPEKPSHGRPIYAVVLAVLLVAAVMLLSGVLVFGAHAYANTITFTGYELLGKPTDTSITINIVPASSIEYYYDYGTTQEDRIRAGHPTPLPPAANRTKSSSPVLPPTRKYYYRMVYDGDGDVDDGDYEVRDEHTFRTQRAEGAGFVFTVTSDSHAQFNTNHQNAWTNILNELPDFEIDLGDTFYPGAASSQSAVNNAYLAYREPLYMGKIGHSVPIFLAAGNHEDEEGWNLDDTPFSSAVGSIQARKAFFPTPIDDGGFYSGNTDPLASDRRSDLRRRVSRGLLRLDVGRRVVRGH